MEWRLLCVCLSVLLIALLQQAQCRAHSKHQRERENKKQLRDYRTYDDDDYYDFEGSAFYDYDSSEEEDPRDFYEYGRKGNWLQPKRTNNRVGAQLAPYRNNEVEMAEEQLEELRMKMNKLTRKMEDIQNAIDPWNRFYDKK